MKKYAKKCILLISVAFLLNCCQSAKKTTTAQQDKLEGLIYKPILYVMGQFQWPKYYDLSERIKRLVVISPKYNKGYKREVQDMVVQELWGFSIQVIEREQMDALLEEQELSTSELISTESAIKIGKILGADHIFTYSLET